MTREKRQNPIRFPTGIGLSTGTTLSMKDQRNGGCTIVLGALGRSDQGTLKARDGGNEYARVCAETKSPSAESTE